MRHALPAATALLLSAAAVMGAAMGTAGALAQPASQPDQRSPEYAACVARAQSTPDTTACSAAEAARWDRRLNAAYGAITRSPNWNAATKGLLRDAQRAWITYRDRACAAEGELAAEGGTLARVVAGDCVTALTADRALRLEASLKGMGQ